MTHRPLFTLAPGEDARPQVLNPRGTSRFLLTADHASATVPACLGDLGLTDEQRHWHIGWDIGIAGVTRFLAEALDATAVLAPFSRLVVDLNRWPEDPNAMPAVTGGVAVPGNAEISPEERAARLAALHAPYHDALHAVLDARGEQPTVFIALHSFTPSWAGVARPWEVGVLHHTDPATASYLLDAFRAEGDLTVGDNEPYTLADGVDHSVPRHAVARGLAHVELEIRQDEIATEAGQRAWAARLARVLPGLPERP